MKEPVTSSIGGPFSVRQYPIACRVNHERLADAAQAGIKYVEVDVPQRDQVSSFRKTLAELNLVPSSVVVRMDIRSDAGISHVGQAFATVEQLGAQIVFTSIRTDDADRTAALQRLRSVGHWAQQHGITVAMETHPDLAANGQAALDTMAAVRHDNIRINFDTANVYYYNHDVDTVGELRKILPYVASLHLKDTTGEFHSFEFPPLGDGIVDFPGVLALLEGSQFAGPLTLELEGPAVDRVGFRQALRSSLAYLQTLGLQP